MDLLQLLIVGIFLSVVYLIERTTDKRTLLILVSQSLDIVKHLHRLKNPDFYYTDELQATRIGKKKNTIIHRKPLESTKKPIHDYVFRESIYTDILIAIKNGRTGVSDKVDCSIFFTEDGLSVDPRFHDNIDKFISYMKKSGISLKYLSTEEAKKELEELKSHKKVGYKSAMIWFKDLETNHFFVILPGEPGIVWVRNEPLSKEKKFHLLYRQISNSPPSYLSSLHTFFGNHVSLTSDIKKALTFYWKRISHEGKKVLEGSDIIHLYTEDGKYLEAFWSGIYLVSKMQSYGWKVVSNQSDQIHIDDTVSLVSQKYPDQKLIWKGSLTTAKSPGYWKFVSSTNCNTDCYKSR
jgi:hypothetical protein